MYGGYQYTQSGGAMKVLCVFLGLILIGAVVAGVMLGGSELFSPSLNAAKADKLKAETAALRAQAAYEQRQREMELRLAEQKAAAELQALQDRRAVESELLEITATVGPVVASAVMIILAAAVSYYLIAKARALPKGQAVKETQRSDQETLPSVIQRSNIGAFDVSYYAFLAFCADFILSDGCRVLPLDCTQPDVRRKYYPNGISPDVAQIYFLILCQARIVTLKTNGRSEWVLRQRISTIDDISFRIPCETFNEVANLYLRLSQIESMTVPETEPEHSLD
jgi:hypothetical protein